MQWYRQVFPHLGYHLLLDIVKAQKQKNENNDYFIFTSNVDNVLQRTGFDESKMYEKQGSYAFLQCKQGSACNNSTWLAQPVLSAFENEINPVTFEIPKNLQHLIPKCPNCSRPAYHNAHADDFWISTRYEQQELRFRNWLKANESKRLVVIELGCGERLPFIRYPVENIVHRHTGASCSLIRINPTEPHIPEELNGENYSFGLGAVDGLKLLASQLGIDISEERVSAIDALVKAHSRPPRLPLGITPQNAPDIDALPDAPRRYYSQRQQGK